MVINGDAKLIAGAFVKARGEMTATVTKDGKGNFGRYATLAAIVEATAAPLAKHGLAIMQEAQLDESGVTVDTWLIHESGATMQFAPLTMPLTQRTPQAVGSATTYARRYQLASVCGLAPDDDDAQTAQDAKPAAQGTPRTPQKAPGGVAPKRQVDAATGEIAPSDDEMWEPDQPAKPNLPVLSDAQLTRLNIAGVDLYGAKEWDEQRPKLVQAVSKGAVTSSKELTPDEASKLIKGIEKKLLEVAAIKAAKAQQQPDAVAA